MSLKEFDPSLDTTTDVTDCDHDTLLAIWAWGDMNVALDISVRFRPG
jgi:hypothetical protein